MMKWFLMLLLVVLYFNCTCQEKLNTSNIELDSTSFKKIKEQLNGCWKTKYYQFKYQNNLGGEYKSRVHSSAPIFKLIIKDGEVFLEWIELTGGGSFQKVISINKNKLIVENEDNLKVIYKRNKNCSSQVRGIK
ncbi:MAG: hypothetical protein COA32_15165 [Fluviicola sp.]|nr:MAG: hypothetical protein COA32_15165 [Fluviicola sp.]